MRELTTLKVFSFSLAWNYHALNRIFDFKKNKQNTTAYLNLTVGSKIKHMTKTIVSSVQ